jgi:hypothetical protein
MVLLVLTLPMTHILNRSHVAACRTSFHIQQKYKPRSETRPPMTPTENLELASHYKIRIEQ